MTGKNLKPVIIWLYLGVFLIVLMVLAGGAVRLTDSGLSIVKWDPITGIIPPLNDADWEKEFNDYKNIPEFQLKNNSFDLSDFKKIYLWEYFHRLIARIIGFVFLIPFLIFWIKGYFKHPRLLLKIFIIFLFALFQAWLGWFMVRSGFSGRIDVSHYRLAIHLIFATLLAAYVLWIAMSLTFEKKLGPAQRGLTLWSVIALILITFQLVYGAFTAGLRAGYFYTQYPKMGGEWFPSLSIKSFDEYGLVSLISDPGIVHFIHRWFAILVLILAVIFYFRFRKMFNKSRIELPLRLSLLTVLLQVLLGILTVLTKVNIVIALMHQVNGIILFLCFVSLLFFSLNSIKTKLIE